MNLKKTIRLLLVLGCFSAFMAEPARAQQESLKELISQAQQLGIEQGLLDELSARAENSGIEAHQIGSIVQSAVSLAGDKLPSDHIIHKALEGMSKGVPGDRIIQVLNNIQRATQQSAQIIEPWLQNSSVKHMVSSSGQQTVQEFRNELIKSSSKAVSQSVSITVISEILSEIDNESVLSKTMPSHIVSAVGVLPDLPTTATQPEVSRAFIVRALKGGFGTAEFQKLPMALNMAQARNQMPASSVLQGVSSQLQGGIPATQVLENIFNGNIGGGPQGNIPKGLGNGLGRGRGNN